LPDSISTDRGRPIRVVELGGEPAAAFCGKLYARWGAEVVRVQDSTGPPDDSPAAAALDLYLNRGKRRVALDWSSAKGRELLDRLVARCDILVTDLAPAALDAVEWQTLGSGNAALIRCAITPFGLTGPYRDWQATPANLLALGGYTHIMGDPGRAPLTMPGHYVEYQSGTLAYTATLASVLADEPSGRTIDISMLEVVASLSQFTTVMWTHGGAVRSRHGNRWENIHPNSLYPCKDGWWFPCIVPPFWEPFTYMIGRPELIEDERFNTSDGRVLNWAELDAIIVDAAKDTTMAKLLAEGQETWRVPVGAQLGLQAVLDEEHLRLREFWQEAGGDIRLPASPFRYADEPLPIEPAYSDVEDSGLVLAGLEGAD
jgi:crotonobetainyl-CoA:carnitine CoA-transferase CaiB-like acyl-CoA transferase